MAIRHVNNFIHKIQEKASVQKLAAEKVVTVACGITISYRQAQQLLLGEIVDSSVTKFKVLSKLF